MKNPKTLKPTVITWILLILLTGMTLVGCGGSSGGEDNNPSHHSTQPQPGEWDSMVWDQDNWQ